MLGTTTELPIRPQGRAVTVSKQRWLKLFDRLVETAGEQTSEVDHKLPISGHLRADDVAWKRDRLITKWILQAIILVVTAVYLVQLTRAWMLPETWLPRAETLATTINWSALPILMIAWYVVCYHVPWVRRRMIMPVMTLIGANDDGSMRWACVKTREQVALYRGRAASYLNWTEHGLEVRPQQRRMVFLIPKRLVSSQQQELLARTFPADTPSNQDNIDHQHWAGPFIP